MGSATAWQRLALVLLGALIALVILWQCFTPGDLGPWHRVLLGALLTLPLWAPLHGLIRGQRRTFAWATLCVIPYFVIGVTEAIANPATRSWSASCLALALVLFVSLIGYLRITRPAGGAA